MRRHHDREEQHEQITPMDRGLPVGNGKADGNDTAAQREQDAQTFRDRHSIVSGEHAQSRGTGGQKPVNQRIVHHAGMHEAPRRNRVREHPEKAHEAQPQEPISRQ